MRTPNRVTTHYPPRYGLIARAMRWANSDWHLFSDRTDRVVNTVLMIVCAAIVLMIVAHGPIVAFFGGR